MQDFSPEDQYQLRRIQMIANKKALEAQRAQQELDRLVLDLEHKYAMLAAGRTAQVTPLIDGLSQTRRSNGKGEPELIPVASSSESSN